MTQTATAAPKSYRSNLQLPLSLSQWEARDETEGGEWRGRARERWMENGTEATDAAHAGAVGGG